MRTSTCGAAAFTMVVAAALAVAAPLPAQALEAQRWSGEDRFATAASIAAHAFPDPSGTVFVVNGLGFADALAAAPAAAHRGAPVLPVLADAVPGPVRTELARLRPADIVVVGGRIAIGDAVVDELAAYASVGVERWSGESRYGTALTVASREFSGSADEVLVASGEGYADALAAGAVGAATSAPLLLTARDTLPQETREALALLSPSRITVVGGTSAVSAEVGSALSAYASGEVRRLAGGDRYETAALTVQDAWGSTPRVLLASGANFPDALAGAALGRPLLLSEPQCLSAATAAAYSALDVESVTGLGGTAAISEAALAGVVCTSTPAPDPVPAPPGDPGDAVDCGDFVAWRDAQNWFETYYPSYGDVARLDQDDDLVACEGLPGAPG